MTELNQWNCTYNEAIRVLTYVTEYRQKYVRFENSKLMFSTSRTM